MPVGHQLDDLLDIIDKAHVQHAVELVQHQGGERTKVERTALVRSSKRPGVPTMVVAFLQFAQIGIDIGSTDEGGQYIPGDWSGCETPLPPEGRVHGKTRADGKSGSCNHIWIMGDQEGCCLASSGLGYARISDSAIPGSMAWSWIGVVVVYPWP